MVTLLLALLLCIQHIIYIMLHVVDSLLYILHLMSEVFFLWLRLSAVFVILLAMWYHGIAKSVLCFPGRIFILCVSQSLIWSKITEGYKHYTRYYRVGRNMHKLFVQLYPIGMDVIWCIKAAVVQHQFIEVMVTLSPWYRLLRMVWYRYWFTFICMALERVYRKKLSPHGEVLIDRRKHLFKYHPLSFIASIKYRFDYLAWKDWFEMVQKSFDTTHIRLYRFVKFHTYTQKIREKYIYWMSYIHPNYSWTRIFPKVWLIFRNRVYIPFAKKYLWPWRDLYRFIRWRNAALKPEFDEITCIGRLRGKVSGCECYMNRVNRRRWGYPDEVWEGIREKWIPLDEQLKLVAEECSKIRQLYPRYKLSGIEAALETMRSRPLGIKKGKGFVILDYYSRNFDLPTYMLDQNCLVEDLTLLEKRCPKWDRLLINHPDIKVNVYEGCFEHEFFNLNPILRNKYPGTQCKSMVVVKGYWELKWESISYWFQSWRSYKVRDDWIFNTLKEQYPELTRQAYNELTAYTIGNAYKLIKSLLGFPNPWIDDLRRLYAPDLEMMAQLDHRVRPPKKKRKQKWKEHNLRHVNWFNKVELMKNKVFKVTWLHRFYDFAPFEQWVLSPLLRHLKSYSKQAWRSISHGWSYLCNRFAPNRKT